MQYDVLGVRIDDMSREALLARLLEFLRSDRPHVVVTPNAEFVLAAQRDPDYRALLNRSDLAVLDGSGLQYAVAALSGGRSHRHPGVDLVADLVHLATQEKRVVAAVGGNAFSLGQMKQHFATQAAGAVLRTIDPGVVPDVNGHDLLSQSVIDQLLKEEVTVVIVGLGSGKSGRSGRQERVLYEVARRVPSARIIIGAGGTIDFYGKDAVRAPKSWNRYGFEWAWRLIHEPWRWRRIVNAVIVFPITVAWATLVQKRFGLALRNVARELYRNFR